MYRQNTMLAEKMKQMLAQAQAAGLLLLIYYEARWAIAGIPDEINEHCISFPAMSVEVGSTGTLGGEPAEWELNPYPKVIRWDAVRFFEMIPAPKGYTPGVGVTK